HLTLWTPSRSRHQQPWRRPPTLDAYPSCPFLQPSFRRCTQHTGEVLVVTRLKRPAPPEPKYASCWGHGWPTSDREQKRYLLSPSSENQAQNSTANYRCHAQQSSPVPPRFHRDR